MRIALISDIHGNRWALAAVLDHIARQRVDAIWNLGDILSGPLEPAATADLLAPLALPTIRGNHERQLLTLARERMSPADAYAAGQLAGDDVAWLAGLPATLDLGHGVWCCHGTPTSDLQYFLETVMPDLGRNGSPGVRAARADEVAARLGDVAWPLVLCGHTHMPRLAFSAATLVVNPGSVGLPAFDDDHPHPHRMETGTPLARWALVERTAAGWQAQLRGTAYDFESAARRAEANGRGDWADALRSGFVGRLESEVSPASRAGPG
jgi:predicted phosphodiesterase